MLAQPLARVTAIIFCAAFFWRNWGYSYSAEYSPLLGQYSSSPIIHQILTELEASDSNVKSHTASTVLSFVRPTNSRHVRYLELAVAIILSSVTQRCHSPCFITLWF